MKKLLILASAIGMTCAVSAASCMWGFGSGAADTNGDWFEGGTAFLYSGNVSFDSSTGWDLSSATFIASAGYDTNMGGYGYLDSGNLPSYDGVALSDGDAYTLILVDGSASDLASWTGDGKNYYLESITSSALTEPTATGSISYTYLSSDTYVENWSSAAVSGGDTPSPIPEPTSGLLMLLGMAGLALRRRRA